MGTERITAQIVVFGLIMVSSLSACTDDNVPSANESNMTASGGVVAVMSATGGSSGQNSAAETRPTGEPKCIPRDQAPVMPETATAYAELCSQYLGRVPTADCGKGVRIPITVNGVEVFDVPENNVCDHTGFKGECAPGSTIRRQEGESLDGTARPEVIWVTFCRSTGAFSNLGLGSVQMIGHNTETGATCFFESPDAIGRVAQTEWVSLNNDGLLDGTLPGPGDPDFDKAFIPAPPECTTCHHNDPFIHNPWIDGARMPDNPNEPVLPEIATANSPYWVVGGPNWDLRTPHIEGNACVTCHRVGMGTVDIFESLGVLDVNDTMPPHAPGSEAEAFADIRACWEQGPGKVPGCEWKSPPGIYCGEPSGTPGPSGVVEEASGKKPADEDDKGNDVGPCPDDVATGGSCTGDWMTTLCTDESGSLWWCEDGGWTNKK